MLWHIYLTRFCNLSCSYCGNDPRFESIASEPQYSVDELVNFLKHDKYPIINFYGGEPLLRIKRMLKIIDSALKKVPNVKFVLQTNGMLLNKIPQSHINNFNSILVSIDGRREITNGYRGDAVFETITKNVFHLRHKLKFSGELIARMTVSKSSDIFSEVTALLDSEENLGFTHVHWQLDVLWSSNTWENLPEWLNKVYNPGIQQLAGWWLKQIEEKHKIYGIIPFLGIISSLLTNKPTELRCGSGVTSFTISTDGSLIFCPICPEESDAIVGSIRKPKEIKKVQVQEPCTSCPVLDICGGRCLYTNYFRYASDEEYDAVCSATKYLINELKIILPNVKELILSKIISLDQLNYPIINNGAEIIP